MKKTSYTKNISIAPVFKKQIAEELDTTTQTVHCALLYFNNSVLAHKIRARAKELLIAEAEKITS